MNNSKNIFSLLGSYKSTVGLLIIFTIFSNGLSLFIPKLIATAIDHYGTGTLITHTLIVQFALVTISVLIFTYAQSIMQVLASERVAKDLRSTLVTALSKQSYKAIQTLTPSKLLTTVTSDTDAVKVFISQAVPSLISSIALIIGSAILLISINWRLGLVVLMIIPLIGGTFFGILSRIRPLFGITQQIIDRLNKVISESIIGSALIRVLNAGDTERAKFEAVNANARDNSFKLFPILPY